MGSDVQACEDLTRRGDHIVDMVHRQGDGVIGVRQVLQPLVVSIQPSGRVRPEWAGSQGEPLNRLDRSSESRSPQNWITVDLDAEAAVGGIFGFDVYVQVVPGLRFVRVADSPNCLRS